MSAAGVARTVAQATTPRTRIGRTPRLPSLRKPLKRDENGLPIPPVNIIVRDTYHCRLGEHYYNTLRDDLMAMTYVHEHKPRKEARAIRPRFDPEDPYVKHRHNPVVGGQRWTREPPEPSTSENVITLEKIQIHSFVREAIANRSNLLGAIMALRSISGSSDHEGGRRTVEGVEIVKARKSIGGGWARRGMPVGAKVDLKGPKMYEFMSMLVDFVFPRLKEFNGIIMPHVKNDLIMPSSASGVVSFGLSPEAMGLFPQLEVNLDAYPTAYGMHIHFITNAQGIGAQNRARALLSGFQIPFTRV